MAKLKDLKVTIGLSKRGLTKLNSDLRRTKSNFRRNFGEISNLAKQAGAAIMTGVAAGLTAIVKSGADLQTLRLALGQSWAARKVRPQWSTSSTSSRPPLRFDCKR